MSVPPPPQTEFVSCVCTPPTDRVCNLCLYPPPPTDRVCNLCLYPPPQTEFVSCVCTPPTPQTEFVSCVCTPPPPQTEFVSCVCTPPPQTEFVTNPAHRTRKRLSKEVLQLMRMITLVIPTLVAWPSLMPSTLVSQTPHIPLQYSIKLFADLNLLMFFWNKFLTF